MANLFARVRLKTGNFARGGLDDATVYSSPTGEVIFPRLGRPLPPRPLNATALEPDSTDDRRIYFAKWLTSPKNTYFARAAVERECTSLNCIHTVRSDADCFLLEKSCSGGDVSARAGDEELYR